jgi:PEGA domain
MTPKNRAAAWLRDRRAIPVLTLALLLATTPLTAQDRSRSRPNDSGGPERQAVPRSAPDSSSRPSPPPSYTPPPSRSDSDSDRHARPASPDRDGERQPSRRGRGDGDRHRGGFHGGHFGGYYYPGYYGYWGPRIYWWGSPWWGFYWDPYDHGYPRYYGRGGRAGALDFDVAPARTEIHIDGQYVGKVDAFDGWPQYLWLDKGTYDVVLYLDGYETIARQITVYPGTVISIDDRLARGESVRPEDLASKSTERRDERIRFERERRERIERGEYGEEPDWRDRVRRDRDREDDRDRYADRDEDDNGRDERGGFVRFEIEPSDASVYLDGRFVGTGDDLARLRGGLRVDPGKHRIAVVRPGHRAQEMDFDVDAGEEMEVEIELEETGR